MSCQKQQFTILLFLAISCLPMLANNNSKEAELGGNIKIEMPKSSDSAYVNLGGYYYGIIEKDGDSWSVKKISVTPINGRLNENQEVIRVSNDYSNITPYFETNKKTYQFGQHKECYLVKPKTYELCSSNLTSINIGMSIGKNILAAAITFGLASGSHKYLNQDLVNEAVNKSGLLNAIELKKIEFEKEEYLKTYQAAQTSKELTSFINKYKNRDFDNLIASASAKLKLLTENEKSENIRLAKQKIENEILQQKIENEQKKLEIKIAREKSHKLEIFRKSLNVGTNTNCGPVIEIKSSLVKVYFPVPNYGNEHWISKEDLFSIDYSCQFLNGRYIKPSF